MDTIMGTIIGIIVGVLFAVTVTIISVVFVIRKRNQRDSRRRQPLKNANTGKNYRIGFKKTIFNEDIICKPRGFTNF